MKYRFDFRPQAQRAIRAIPLEDARRLLTALAALGSDPYAPNPAVKPLTGYQGVYRIRSGDYRAVYTIDDGKLVIRVVDAGRRRDIYRKRQPREDGRPVTAPRSERSRHAGSRRPIGRRSS